MNRLKTLVLSILLVASAFGQTIEPTPVKEARGRAWVEGTRGWSEDGTNLWTAINTYNVGIGTSTPGYRLDVDGNLRLTGGIHDGTGFGNPGQVLVTSGADIYWADFGGSGDYIWNQFGSAQNPGEFWIIGYGRAGDLTTIGGQLNSTASGVVGWSNSSSGAGVLGDGGTATAGLWGQCNIGTDFGVGGFNQNASGTGVIGIGNNTSGSYLTAGSGGAFTGTRFGSFNVGTGAASVGCFAQTNMAVLYTPPAGWDAAVNAMGKRTGVWAMGQRTAGGSEGIGVVGLGDSVTAVNYYSGSGLIGNGLCGVLGYGTGANNIGVWGESGDMTGLYAYGGGIYYGSQLHGYTGACYIASDQPATYYALHVDDYALAVAWHTGKKTSKGTTILHTISSPNSEIYLSGTGRLTDGMATVQFGYPYNELITTDIPITVVVTPTGDCNGIYVVETDAQGFRVKELNNGKSNVGFNWVAIGREKGWQERKDLKLANATPRLKTSKISLYRRATGREMEVKKVR